jgi:hypothetical protein
MSTIEGIYFYSQQPNGQRQATVRFDGPVDAETVHRFRQVETRPDPPYVSMLFGEDYIEVVGVNGDYLLQGLALAGLKIADPPPWERL